VCWKKSVHEAALLELGLEVHEDSIDNPWRTYAMEPQQFAQTVSNLEQSRFVKEDLLSDGEVLS